jgi:hypothetical protein
MKHRRDEKQELRNNKRRKQMQRRLQEREWERERHIWRNGSRVVLEDLEPEEENGER